MKLASFFCLATAFLAFVASADVLRKPFLQRLSAYEVVRPARLSLQSFETENGFAHPHQHTFHFEAMGKVFTFELEKNVGLLAADYRHFVYNGETLVEELRPNVTASNCHYTGRVRGDPNSDVAISTCFGLYGVVYAYNDVFYIQPSEEYMKQEHPIAMAARAHETDHFFYRVQDLETNPATCAHASNLADPTNNHGYGHEDHFNSSEHHHDHHDAHTHGHHRHSHTQLSGMKAFNGSISQSAPSLQAINPNNWLYAELTVVNDVEKLAIWNNDVQNCETHSQSLVNQVGLVYKKNLLNPLVTVMLKNMVTWQGTDPISPTLNSAGESNSDDLLSKFSDWRVKSAGAMQSDVFHLFSGRNFDGSTVGVAYLGTMCRTGSATGVDEIRDTSGFFSVTLVAHELGHNFGMPHDGSGTSASCPQTYIMAPYITSVNPSTFSTCALSAYANWYQANTAQAQCLANVPQASFAPKCGNGFIDDGETCDCGSSDCSTTDPCCNGATCQLNAGATCSNLFPCCQNCQLVPAAANKVCRPALGGCDLEDKCNGVDMNCPADGFQPAGTPCNDGITDGGGVCYKSACVSQAKQCKSLEASYSGKPIVPCSYRNKCADILCGLNGNANDCYFFWGAGGTHLQEDDGMTCGSGLQCVGGQCVSSSTLNPVAYSWKAGTFSTCSQSCGGGMQTRSVTCVSTSGSVVSDSLCTAATKPQTSQSCGTQSCLTFSWSQGGFGACSASCGGGVQTQSVTCKDSTGATVADSLCPSSSKPTTSQSCNSAACTTYSWQQSGFGACSASCGGGSQTQTVTCKDSTGATASDSLCPSSSKPATSQSCNTAACTTYSWQQSGFGACSATCGSGTQTQSVTCKASTGSTVADSFCPSASKPASSQACSVQQCLTYSWQQSGFGACSASCGGGSQTQTVTCKDSTGATASDSLCPSTSKPATSQSCNTAACTTYAWQQSGFGACSATCGSGTQTQSVTCKASTGSTVADSFCPSASKPASSQSCSVQQCLTYAWQQSGFGACSASCGGGSQTQTVTCKDSTGATASDSLCPSSSKPATSQSCNTAACTTYAWQQSGFGACSATCGSGTQTQSVTCKASTGSTVADSFCPSVSKPASSQACSVQQCLTYSWQQSGFGACSASCGAGVQTQTVTCKDSTGATAAASLCDAASKPASQQNCNVATCLTYGWSASGFGTCSASCGGGVQTQSVACKDSTGATVSDSLCSSATKPSTSQACGASPCLTYTWVQSGFGSCSVSCGGGLQTQSVTCKSSSGSIVSESLCSSTKPSSSQACATQSCTYSWTTSAWGSCSASCNGGTRTRTVSCKDGSGAVVSASLCPSSTQPSSSQACATNACGPQWSRGSWTRCSATCGGGVATRSVTCVDNGVVVADSLCTGTKPPTTTSCNDFRCPRYTWSSYPAGSCSKTCGGGVQPLSVRCLWSGFIVPYLFCGSNPPSTTQPCNTQPCS